jgi:uncharacterized Zn finger protein
MRRRRRGDRDDWGFPPYVPVAERREQAEREAAKLEKKGERLSPVTLRGSTIARTFWGKAWCDNLERYSDYSNRLPRGRSYVRNGSVLDLRIAPGEIRALVSGTRLYRVEIRVVPLPKARWTSICADCAGAVDSLVELLQGRFSKAVMERICRERTGLFPHPSEIRFTCSCPDWASMCKHVAAVFYGIGSRLDERPELLFELRKVDGDDLIAKAGKGLALSKIVPGKDRILADDGLAELFGLDLGAVPAEVHARKTGVRKPATSRRKKADQPPIRKKDSSKKKPAGMATEKKAATARKKGKKKKAANYPKCAFPGCPKNRFPRGKGFCGEHFRMWLAGEIAAAAEYLSKDGGT